MSTSVTLAPALAQGRGQRSSRSRTYRLVGAAIALSSAVALPLAASATAVPSYRDSTSSSVQRAAGGHLSSPPASRSSETNDRGVISETIRIIVDRLQNGGTALPRAPESSLQQASVFRRQMAEGPDSDQPISVGSVPFTPLVLIIAGMGFAFVCTLFLVIIINCANPNNSQTGRDRLRAQQDLRLRGAGRRSAVEPYVYGTAGSGASTPRYNAPTAAPSKLTRPDKRPPPRSGVNNDSISSRTPLYASHLSQTSNSLAGSDKLFPSSASQRGGHNSYMSSSSGPFGDSMAALAGEPSHRQSNQAPHLPQLFTDRGGYRPSPLPLPPMSRSYDSSAPASPRGPRPVTSNAMIVQGKDPRQRTNSDVKASRSSTIGRGTDIYRNRGSRAYVPAVNPSAVAPAYPNWGRDNNHATHPLDGSSELKRHTTDPTGSLTASRRNSMLSLSLGSNSNEGSLSPIHTGGLLGGGPIGASGGGTPDSASSSHMSSFSNGLATGPLLPLGSSYLSNGHTGTTVPTGDLVGSGFFGSSVPPVGQRRSPVSAGYGTTSGSGNAGAPPPVPPQKSIYHSRPTSQQGQQGPPLEYAMRPQPAGPRAPGGGVADFRSSYGGGSAYTAGGGAPAGRAGPGAQQRYDDDLEAGGANAQSGLLASNQQQQQQQQQQGIGLAAARAGRYARPPRGPR
ncbi:unnamed protein product [Tilletia controversa]|uniref:Uncharacterized protein n=3 Tax=Tilletia TaxID=13289 RepID=A0A8X7MP05_9BASI|nr:hypothetical protein CF336_g6024 [Tilletia laevis]KAE8192182.1 hypothetical protein CF328_g5453 [Tilletia controversa]KAE8256737.1 hypothetical protein A4X03_0g5107 [Tilletia caries]KAE8195311.1 hypothetical protein CF335_g5127 [Tilletia laevis]KAE8243570.1 hypothetical protein A4X06_0g6228 [Tilletia controversa]